jgi:hypothetical protein
MQTFSRLFSIVTFLLSLGFIAQALPTPANGGALSVRQYGAPVSSGGNSGNGDSYGTNGAIDVLAVMVDLKAKVDPILVELGE